LEYKYVTLNTLISLSTSEHAQGGTLGAAWAMAALAQTVAPILSPSVFSFGVTIGFNGLVFAVSAVITAATMPFVLNFRKVAKDGAR
jgi:hypothetical protein